MNNLLCSCYKQEFSSQTMTKEIFHVWILLQKIFFAKSHYAKYYAGVLMYCHVNSMPKQQSIEYINLQKEKRILLSYIGQFVHAKYYQFEFEIKKNIE